MRELQRENVWADYKITIIIWVHTDLIRQAEENFGQSTVGSIKTRQYKDLL